MNNHSAYFLASRA